MRHNVRLDGERARPQWWRTAWRHVAIAVVALSLATSAVAAPAQDEELPARVGRLADFAGQILFSTQDKPDDWQPVGTNYPITSGANLWASADGRAEIDYGGGQFRVAGDTNVHVARLDDRQLTLFVAQGRVIVRVRVQDPGDATFVDTPNSHLTLLRPGLYRIDVAPDRETTSLIVREGEAAVALPTAARQVLAGQAIAIGGGEPVVSEVRYAQAADGFDTWSANRDRGYEGSRSAAYVSRQMVGASDLDRYGAWQNTREYGPVWFPYAAAPDWAPYSDGYWVDIGGWGPTWVDSAPWGYAPFHYGRWAFIGGRWGWCPGGYVARPAWAPALVAWYGGPRFGVGIAGGRPLYGWVPLGWREPYYPGWRRCSANCWARFNRPYGVDPTASAPPARHVNLAVPGALSAVPAVTLAGRAPVRPNLVSVPGDLASSATPMRSVPPIRLEERQAPRPPSDSSSVPRAASTYARVPAAEAASAARQRPLAPTPVPTTAPTRPGSSQPPTASRAPVTGTLQPPTSALAAPARPGPAPSQRGLEIPAPAYGTHRGAVPAGDVPPQRMQPRSTPPAVPASSGSSALPQIPAPATPISVAPRGAPPVAAPVPSVPSPPAHPPAATAGSGTGAGRSMPEPPSAPEPRR